MHTRLASIAAILLALAVPAAAQKPDPDAQKLASQYEAAFNKSDVKTLTSLYTADAIRLGPDGQLVAGRSAIEESYVKGFGGALKGATLTLTMGRTLSVTSDVKVIEGTFSVAGALPVKGRFINTIVRQKGQWLLASVTTRPDLPPAK